MKIKKLLKKIEEQLNYIKILSEDEIPSEDEIKTHCNLSLDLLDELADMIEE